MDQSTFQKLTGTTLDCEAARFKLVTDLAKEQLEGMLGWPLDPADWPNQYDEEGKGPGNNGTCPDADAELDDPDAVVGKYRLFPWTGTDLYLHIDPATAIHAVKLVKDDITCKTFDVDDYRIQWSNGAVPIARYIKLCNDCLCPCEDYVNQANCRMLAVDADWAYADDLPLQLQKIWAALIAFELDENKNIKSESITSHSYTKFESKSVQEEYFAVLQKYVGPRGISKPNRIV